MKAVILAGGTGSSLKPLTSWTNKHLLPVGSYPMICYGVAKLREAGLRDILLITGKSSLAGFADLLGSGRDWGVSIGYMVEEEAGGIAKAIRLARPTMVPGEKFAVLLGDNLFEESLLPYRESFEDQEDGAMVVLKKMQNPCLFGVPVIEPGSLQITRIVEKPTHPPTPYGVTGLYFFDDEVFDVMDTIRPSYQGNLEISDVLNDYALQGKLDYRELQGWWTDTRSFESMEAAGKKLKGYLP